METGISWAHIGFFLVAWGAVQIGFTTLNQPELLGGAQADSDGYFRLVRVHLLLEGHGWFNSTIPGSNWPYGEELHWTRLLDLLIIALAAPFLVFTSQSTALAVSGSLISLLIHAALCILAVWIVRPLAQRNTRYLAMPVLLAQPGLWIYGSLGRADHHMLLLLLTALMLGWWIRALMGVRPHRNGRLVAGAAALALWVSPEALIPLVAIYVSGAVAWIFSTPRADDANVAFSRWLVPSLVLVLMLERHPSAWLTAEYDRISVVHLTMALIAYGFWLGARATRQAEGRTASRAIVVLWGGVLSIALLLLIHPSFLRGPAAHADPAVWGTLLPLIDELQPIFRWNWQTLGTALMYAGGGVVAAVFLTWKVVSTRRQPTWPAWVALLTSIVVFLPLGLHQLRLVGYQALVAGLSLSLFLGMWLARIDLQFRGLRRRLMRVTAMLFLTIGFVVSGGALGAVTMFLLGDGEAEEWAGAPGAGCSIRNLAHLIEAYTNEGNEALVVAISPNMGPELHYRTGHRILSGPYHRSSAGIRDLTQLFTASEDSTAVRIIKDRGIDVIVLCPASEFASFGSGPDDSLYQQLRRGEGPAWAVAWMNQDVQDAGFHIFGVDTDALR